MSEPEKKPLKSLFTFRFKPPKPNQDLDEAEIEYLFNDKRVAREDWVALQQHMFLKAVGNEDSRSLFERIFGKAMP
jgi:hypothetical protein